MSGGSVRLLDVANALAIYFGERCSGPFHDTYLTFSEHPQLVDLSTGKSLRDKLQIALTHAEVANTNVEAAFQLILDTAVKHHLPQEELLGRCSSSPTWSLTAAPKGQTAQAWTSGCSRSSGSGTGGQGTGCPGWCFWNICSRTMTIPVKENQLGVTLISGFSPNVAQMVLDGEVNPYTALVKMLESPRYAPVGQALAGL